MENDETMIARMLVVAYLLGAKGAVTADIPETISAMMAKGHDGLNWQAFLPLAEDILKQVRRPDDHGE